MSSTASPPAHGRDRLSVHVESARRAERAGAWDDALEHYEAAFRRLPHEGDAAGAAELLRWIGHIHRQRGDGELAEETYRASLAVARAADCRDHIAEALNSLAIVAQFGGDPGRAERLYDEARELAEHLGNTRLAAMVDQNLGALANMRGDSTTALRSYSSALDRYLGLDDHRSGAAALNNMGMVHRDRQAWDAAEACFRRAAHLARTVEHPESLAHVELNRGELYLKRQMFEQARQACDRAMEIFSRLGSRKGLAEVYRLYGSLYRQTSRLNLAEIHLTLGLQLAGECGDRLLEAETHNEWARVYLDFGRNRDAIAALNRAHRLFSALEARRELADIDRRFQHLEQHYLTAAEEWSADAIESKDPYTAGHSRRVANYSSRLAEVVGFDGSDLTGLRVGALLHDIGKSVVPSDVLTKPAALTRKERNLIESHTVVGDAIVAELEFPWDLRPLIRHHHERWDGSGYPDGLQGEDIPILARVLTVADVYDAVTSDRSYHDAFSHDKAIRLMEGVKGRLLDPELFDTFRDLADESWASATASSISAA